MKRKTEKEFVIKKPLWKRYYWILGRDGGKRVVMGAYNSYDDADVDGYSNFQEYEIIPLRTANRAEASRIIRKKVLDNTHSVEDTFQRFKHLDKEDLEE